MANNLVAVPDNVICDAVKFLILNTQQPDGIFKEVGQMYHGEMIVRPLISLTSILNLEAKRKLLIKLKTITCHCVSSYYVCMCRVMCVARIQTPP